MAVPSIQKRKRFFLAVEGESEQAFVTWLQRLSDMELRNHLDGYPLGGGGFKSMLEKAVHLHDRNRKNKGVYKNRFLIVDGDRAARGDWSIEKLKQEAAKHALIVCVQRPNHEGLLFRMMHGKENEIPEVGACMAKLKAHWPNYEKPMNALALSRQFSIDDLLRVANVDVDLEGLLKAIGLIK